MNIIKLFLSILLFIINLKQENNRIMSVELCLNYQVSICCIIHSISYFFFPVDEEGMVARIQGCIDMTMDITILYIIASICFTLLVFYNDPEKEEQRKTYMLIMTLISWLIPISFGVLAFFKGNVTKNYASYFSWHSVGYFNFIFSGYFWAALIAGFIFIAMLYFKVRGNTANENFKTYNFTIKLYFITLFISIFIYCYDLIVKYLLNSEHPFFEYFGCVVENAVEDVAAKMSIVTERQQEVIRNRNESIINIITIFGIVSIVASVLSIVQILSDGNPVFWASTILTSLAMTLVLWLAMHLRR